MQSVLYLFYIQLQPSPNTATRPTLTIKSDLPLHGCNLGVGPAIPMDPITLDATRSASSTTAVAISDRFKLHGCKWRLSSITSNEPKKMKHSSPVVSGQLYQTLEPPLELPPTLEMSLNPSLLPTKTTCWSNDWKQKQKNMLANRTWEKDDTCWSQWTDQLGEIAKNDYEVSDLQPCHVHHISCGLWIAVAVPYSTTAFHEHVEKFCKGGSLLSQNMKTLDISFFTPSLANNPPVDSQEPQPLHLC
jgi:hypothetical protein